VEAFGRRCRWHVNSNIHSVNYDIEILFLMFLKVHEVITARHCDMKVFAFSLITNKCVTDYENQELGNQSNYLLIKILHQTKLFSY